MRRSWLLLGVGVLAALLALGAVACGDDDEAEDGEVPTIAGMTPIEGETPEAGAEIAPITLAEEGGSGVTGSATITATATGGADVSVTIDGGLEPGTHQNHLHHGTCAAQGEVHVPLTDLEAGDDGSASGETTIDDPPFSHWLEREHYLAAHAIDGTVVTCGDVVEAS